MNQEDNASNALLDQIVVVGRSVSSSSVELLCQALEQLPDGYTKTQCRVVVSVIASQGTRQHFLSVVDLWLEHELPIPPVALAWALRASSQTEKQRQQEQSLELVWTGPNPKKTPLRRIDQALLSLLNEAKESILLVTYASYKIPNIRKALLESIKRGVKVTLVVESHEKEDGNDSFPPLYAFGKELSSKAEVFFWPLANRERDENGHRGVLHVKCAIIDGKAMLLSSANLTGSAMTMNMELGVLIRGGNMPEQVERHLLSLQEYRILEENTNVERS